MSDSLIERVRALAEAQEAIPEGAQLEGTMYGTVDAAYFVQQASAFDFPALLAHMQAQQAMVAEAREERVEAAKRLSKQAARWLDDFIADSELIDAINGELAAALENLETNDGK